MKDPDTRRLETVDQAMVAFSVATAPYYSLDVLDVIRIHADLGRDDLGLRYALHLLPRFRHHKVHRPPATQSR